MKSVDASFIIRLITSSNNTNSYNIKWQEWQSCNTVIVAPTLIMYEVSNGIYRYQKAGQITQDEAESLLNSALNLGIQFYGDSNLHQEALKLANLYNLSATYDAHYLALAQRLQVELWTADKRLFNTVSPSLSWVKLLEVN
ncbi:type II toxin-antitoxin system VapC family toxin [Crocosphaera sp. UHCC 0190]|uniref:type II toxin-antitoxin system VapC family toxin n=1 Tax=Crocosphaera sp. UHCC 0190 TaxID=3110246 RepID=UPI002B1F09D9|nr:type II toxin-antitoxin system VapC family toxin [Crocosphaera sp. UHCC 0190]MEA5512317.1 type II toxin-antitoxin system VapC family toxin [Crocosphaera sp. UHCC 0190]